MKRIFLWSILLLIGAGCASYVEETDGRRYAALTDRQRAYLIDVSRRALTKHVKKGLVTAQESAYAAQTEPEFRVRYRGDRYGSAVVVWRTPGRQLEFHFEDDLTVEIPVCSFAVRQIPPSERRLQPDKSIPGR